MAAELSRDGGLRRGDAHYGGIEVRIRNMTRASKRLMDTLSAIARWLREARERLYPTRPTQIDVTLRQSAFDALSDPTVANIQSGNDVATFVLGEIKDEARMKMEGLRNLEQKASTQITIAGTLIAIFTALNRHMDPRWLTLPLSFFILAIIFSIWALWTRTEALPSPGAYNYEKTINNANKAQVAVVLAEAWIGYSLDVQLKAGQRRRIITAAWLLIFLGLASLFYVSTYRGLSQNQAVHCIISLKDDTHDLPFELSHAAAAGQRQRHPAGGAPRGSSGRGLQARTIDYLRCSIPDSQ